MYTCLFKACITLNTYILYFVTLILTVIRPKAKKASVEAVLRKHSALEEEFDRLDDKGQNYDPLIDDEEEVEDLDLTTIKHHYLGPKQQQQQQSSSSTGSGSKGHNSDPSSSTPGWVLTSTLKRGRTTVAGEGNNSSGNNNRKK